MEGDRKLTAKLSSTMYNLLKGRPVQELKHLIISSLDNAGYKANNVLIQGRIFQGKEPSQFVAIFQPMVILKVATALNSNECFLLQSGSSFFRWHGNQSTFEQQQCTAKVAEFLKPGSAVKHTKEWTETSSFWFAVGGKQSYTSKKVSPDVVRDPHLYWLSPNKGRFEVEEVYDFSQDDLLTEDILLLDTHVEVFVWVGQLMDPKEKQNAFEIGQKYIEIASSLEGLSPYVPLYKVVEGNEPCFFTAFFSWDPAKASAHGNSFQKKIMLLFGAGHAAVEKHNSSNQGGGGPTQRASALAALNSAFKSTSSPNASSASRPGGNGQGSQRAAAVAALSSVLTAETKKSPDVCPARPSRSPPVEASQHVSLKSEDCRDQRL